MSDITKEKTFEANIEDVLITKGGYVKGGTKDYLSDIGIDQKTLLQFLQKSQLEKWSQLEELHQDSIEDKVIQRLVKELDIKGMLRCIREGIDDHGVHIDLAYFKPESGLNPDTIEKYEQNILSVTRQVHFSTREPEKSVDMVLFLNGLPVATVELKNPFTGQNVSDAKKQFMYTRDNREILFQFKKRALVHFAVDPDEVYMTTKLQGKETRFLPFNLGFKNGSGNPPNPEGYKTAYLWEEIWSKNSWMDIIRRFIHLEKDEIKVNGRTKTKETMIFPRFHQLDVVRKITQDTKENGVGKNYLIQHSAGSGKSNSIAWLAYRLSSLHDAEDKQIFDSVIVVTDRVVLDQQLQDTIFQFDHKSGVVEKIDQDSAQLGNAIKAGVKIIITTVQKFPYILDRINEFKARKYAVIVDEAHSSQGGETSKKMKEVLTARTLEEAEKEDVSSEETYEDEIRQSMEARGKQENLSFFAFTATPKPKTLEVFGTTSIDSKPRSFHLYSMRQAIEEGFILDVLKNYTTYKTYFKISKAIEDDPEMNKKKASRAIARFLTLHPHNLAQKTEVMVEHFRQVTMKKIGGHAKAMVVTSSRLHAYRYWQEFKKYINEKGYTDIKTLVAFSGGLSDPDTGEKVFEPELNGFGEKQLPERFNTDEYRILLVADKYQTGFDQPLLHTMYVDKKLSGVQAVQTLSRLNRTHTGKEDTFVLDFTNTTDEILEAFQPYYERTALSERTDPNHLYDLKNKLEEKQIFWDSEVENFAKIFFKPQQKQTIHDQAKLYAIIQPAIDRFKALEEKEQDEYKITSTAFIRTYALLSQILPFSDVKLEKLYAFTRLLRNALPKEESDRFELNDEVALQYYRLQKISEGTGVLEKEGEVELDPTIREAGIKRDKDDEDLAKLTEIIKIVNERYSTDFADADRLFIDQVEEDIYNNKELMEQAKVNSKDNFKYPFGDELLDMLIQRMERNEDFAMKFINDSKLRTKLENYLISKIYKKLEKEDVEKLIKQGESQNLEFKSTLRWDVKQKNVNKELEKIILKTIAGYMNSDGGQLIIGVEDNGNIFGLENDYKALGNADRDKFENHLVQIIKTSIGVEYVKYANIIFDEVDHKDVCLITVLKADKPAYVDFKGKEEFFVRTGNNTSPLSIKEAQEYIRNHWTS
ncbi:MAG: putative DNA binding domain-containing protein [Deltaproteobacteria bacterium]